jgi:hypothetical protein
MPNKNSLLNDNKTDGKPVEIDKTMDKFIRWHSNSSTLRTSYDNRWSKNIKLLKGIWPENEENRSIVRGRSKLFFRKIWATRWRLNASAYSAFLRDQVTFKFEGRDTINDPKKAFILQKIVEYRRDILMRSKSLFIKFMWAFSNIFDYGVAYGLFTWRYDKENKIDEPVFTLYPPEQVFPDFTAETKEDMRYIIFEDYPTKEDLEDMGYDNIEDIEFTAIPSNKVRATRHYKTNDPLQNPGDNEYAEPGRYADDEKDKGVGATVKIWKIFYREKNRLKLAIIAPNQKIYLKKPADSPYGDRYNVVMGSCLLEAHKLIGEGFPEPLEGPQESLNANLNMRKDNVALALNKMNVVSRFGNVDLQSLVNSRPGGVVLADDVGAVKEIDHRDVTGSSYNEASIDESMMQEMSGITPGKQGLGKEQKATVAQINFSEGNAKIDLFLAIIGETWVKDFYTTLAYLIIKFETDEKVFKIANESFRQEVIKEKNDDIYRFLPDEYNIDIEADCILNVGAGTTGRQFEIQQDLMAMDRANMANQASAALAQQGAVPKKGIRFIDTSAIFEELLPKIGHKNIDKYFFTVQQQPQQAPQQGGGQNQALAGKNQPQIGTQAPISTPGAERI